MELGYILTLKSGRKMSCNLKISNMKPVQCKNCKHFIRDIFYKSEGICDNDGRYTREHRVCDLLDTDEKRRNAKIKK